MTYEWLKENKTPGWGGKKARKSENTTPAQVLGERLQDFKERVKSGRPRESAGHVRKPTTEKYQGDNQFPKKKTTVGKEKEGQKRGVESGRGILYISCAGVHSWRVAKNRGED